MQRTFQDTAMTGTGAGLLCVFIFAVLFAPALLWAATDYYVSPTGAAAWANCGPPAKSGSAACSWQTAMANAMADDVVYFRAGTYSIEDACGGWQDVAMNPAHSGTVGHPITFIAYPGETVTIPPCMANPSAAAFGANGRNYIIWDGFRSSMHPSHAGETAWLVYFHNATGSIVRNSHFAGTSYADYHNNSPICIEESNDNEVYNNYFHGCAGGGVNTAAIWLFSGDRAKIHHNTIENCSNGIMQKNPSNDEAEIYNNFINVSHVGIAMGEQGTATGRLKFHNNIIINGSIGIFLDGSSPSMPMRDYEIYNNTIHGSSQVGIHISANATGTLVWNNLISNPAQNLLLYHTGAALPAFSDFNNFHGLSHWNLNWSTDYTTISDWRTATGFDVHSVMTDPGFVNAGGSAAADYKRTTYPADGRGAPYASVMGAYITGYEVIGYTASPVTPPAAPGGLTIQ